MKKIGRRIYYETKTGNIILNTGEERGYVKETTVEEDIETFKVLSERNRDTFDYIELEYGEYAQDFAECNGYRVNPETKELEFSYPDPNEPDEDQELFYQEPLTEQIKILGQDVTDSKIESMEQGQRQSDFEIRLLELEMGAK